MLYAKNYYNRPMFPGAIQKVKVARFYGQGVVPLTRPCAVDAVQTTTTILLPLVAVVVKLLLLLFFNTTSRTNAEATSAATTTYV